MAYGAQQSDGVLLVKWFTKILIGLGLVIWLVVAVIQADQARHSTTVWAEDVDDARLLLRKCLKLQGVAQVIEHSIGMWEIKCRWTEE